MRVSGRCKFLLSAVLLAALGGCPLPPRVSPPPPAAVPPAPAPPAPHVGTPYDIAASDSLLTILVYRGGTFASAGHNHVIASHDLSGTIYVPAEILSSSFEVHVPLATLTVDEAALRAQQPAADFPAEVSTGAREGTRRNMLGEALLDAERNPELILRALSLERSPGEAADAATALAHVQATVRGQLRTFVMPVRYRLAANRSLEVSGEFPLRQSELGLTPFSAMLGALQVQDEMHVSFHFIANAAVARSDFSRTP
jgi:hypothetical protein